MRLARILSAVLTDRRSANVRPLRANNRLRLAIIRPHGRLFAFPVNRKCEAKPPEVAYDVNRIDDSVCSFPWSTLTPPANRIARL